MKELDSEVAQRPDGPVVQQSKSSQSNQPNPNPDHDGTEQPVVGTDTRTAQDGRKTSRSQEIDTRSFHEEAVKNDSLVVFLRIQRKSIKKKGLRSNEKPHTNGFHEFILFCYR